jgi:hypothetical protein
MFVSRIVKVGLDLVLCVANLLGCYNFVNIVRKYVQITELTPEIMNEMIDRIEVHAPDKLSGHREQQVDIYFRFRVAEASVVCQRERKHKSEQAA